MAKWIVEKRIWSLSRERYYEPGDVIEYNDAEAAPLLEKNILRPAVKQSTKTKKQELENGTNN